MLMKSGINPFDSQEAKPYKNDSEILAMTNLVSAYQVCLSCFIPCLYFACTIFIVKLYKSNESQFIFRIMISMNLKRYWNKTGKQLWTIHLLENISKIFCVIYEHRYTHILCMIHKLFVSRMIISSLCNCKSF